MNENMNGRRKRGLRFMDEAMEAIIENSFLDVVKLGKI